MWRGAKGRLNRTLLAAWRTVRALLRRPSALAAAVWAEGSGACVVGGGACKRAASCASLCATWVRHSNGWRLGARVSWRMCTPPGWRVSK